MSDTATVEFQVEGLCCAAVKKGLPGRKATLRLVVLLSGALLTGCMMPCCESCSKQRQPGAEKGASTTIHNHFVGESINDELDGKDIKPANPGAETASPVIHSSSTRGSSLAMSHKGKDRE